MLIPPLAAQYARHDRIPTGPEMRAQASLDLAAKANGVACDLWISGDRGQALAPELDVDVLPNGPDEISRPAGADDPDMYVGTFEMVEQDPAHYLAIALDTDGCEGRTKAKSEPLRNKGGHAVIRDDQDTSSATVKRASMRITSTSRGCTAPLVT